MEAPLKTGRQGFGDDDDGAGGVADEAIDLAEEESAGALFLRKEEQIGIGAGGEAGNFASGGADGDFDAGRAVPVLEKGFDTGQGAVRVERLGGDGLLIQSRFTDLRDDGEDTETGTDAGGEGLGEVEVLEVGGSAIEDDGDGADGTAEIGGFQTAAGGPDGGGGGAEEFGADGAMEGAGKAETVRAGSDDEIKVLGAGEFGEGGGGGALEGDAAALGEMVSLRKEGVEVAVAGGGGIFGVGDGEADVEGVGQLSNGADGAEAGVREVGGEEEVEFSHGVVLFSST